MKAIIKEKSREKIEKQNNNKEEKGIIYN